MKAVRLTSKYLNKNKLKSIQDIDTNVMLLKNDISLFVFNNLKELLILGNFNFTTKYYKNFNNDIITNWETQKLFNMICIFYLNTLKKKFDNIKFEVQNKIVVHYYKKNIKNHKKGDIKDKHIYKKYSSLHRFFKYLMYCIDFSNITNKDINDKLNSFDYKIRERIITFIKNKQNKIYNEIKCIIFNNGTYIKDGYQTSNHSSDCIFTDNSNSKYKNWYAYKLRKNKFIFIPLQINENYHDKYNSNVCHYVQIINNKVNILTTKNDEELFFNDNGDIIGIDINVVNNFITCDNGIVFDYDRKYLSETFKLIKKLDKVGYKNISKNNKRILEKLVKRNEWYFRKVISEFLDYCEDNNIYNIVMEDLNLNSKTFIKNEDGIKYSRVVKLLRLSNIKNWMLLQAEKRGIKVHITPSNYTSQMCPICGNIDRENRPNQETFECINCGHKDNADHNASVNIKNRYFLDVLKNSKLHKLDKFNRLIPNSSNKYFIKNILNEVYKT